MESANLRVVGQHIDLYEESTSVVLGEGADGVGATCFASVSRPGSGGPGNMVGEKVPVRVHGRPGFRNGAGAEGDYLTWQLPDGSWVMASCDLAKDRSSVDAVAAAVQLRKSSIRLPVDPGTLPDGYGFSSIDQDLTRGSTSVYLGRVRPELGGPDADIIISYELGDDPLYRPAGRSTTIGGRPAMVNEKSSSPGVCVFVQRHFVCVDSYLSDTGPYPDRLDELPILMSIAEGLTYASDLDQRSTWFAADRALG